MNNEYSEEYDEEKGPPVPLDMGKVVRTILADKPRVTRFQINWGDLSSENENGNGQEDQQQQQQQQQQQPPILMHSNEFQQQQQQQQQHGSMQQGDASTDITMISSE